MRRILPILALAALAGLTSCSQLGGSDYAYEEVVVAPFEVVSRYPAPGKGGVATWTMVTVGFTVPIDPTSVGSGSITLNGSDVGRLEVSANSLRFDPVGTLAPGTSYEVRLGSGLRSIDGTPLGSTPAWGFKTAGVPTTPDTVILAARPRPR